MNRTLLPPGGSFGSGRVYMEFSFLANAAASPVLVAYPNTGANLFGVGLDVIASIVRTGAGVLVVTLKDSFTKVVAATADIDDTLDDGAYATVGTITNEGTSTPIVFTIRTRSAAGTKADMAVGRKINVQIALKNGTTGAP